MVGSKEQALYFFFNTVSSSCSHKNINNFIRPQPEVLFFKQVKHSLSVRRFIEEKSPSRSRGTAGPAHSRAESSDAGGENSRRTKMSYEKRPASPEDEDGGSTKCRTSSGRVTGGGGHAGHQNDSPNNYLVVFFCYEFLRLLVSQRCFDKKVFEQQKASNYDTDGDQQLHCRHRAGGMIDDNDTTDSSTAGGAAAGLVASGLGAPAASTSVSPRLDPTGVAANPNACSGAAAGGKKHIDKTEQRTIVLSKEAKRQLKLCRNKLFDDAKALAELRCVQYQNFRWIVQHFTGRALQPHGTMNTSEVVGSFSTTSPTAASATHGGGEAARDQNQNAGPPVLPGGRSQMAPESCQQLHKTSNKMEQVAAGNSATSSSSLLRERKHQQAGEDGSTTAARTTESCKNTAKTNYDPSVAAPCIPVRSREFRRKIEDLIPEFVSIYFSRRGSCAVASSTTAAPPGQLLHSTTRTSDNDTGQARPGTSAGRAAAEHVDRDPPDVFSPLFHTVSSALAGELTAVLLEDYRTKMNEPGGQDSTSNGRTLYNNKPEDIKSCRVTPLFDNYDGKSSDHMTTVQSSTNTVINKESDQHQGSTTTSTAGGPPAAGPTQCGARGASYSTTLPTSSSYPQGLSQHLTTFLLAKVKRLERKFFFVVEDRPHNIDPLVLLLHHDHDHSTTCSEQMQNLISLKLRRSFYKLCAALVVQCGRVEKLEFLVAGRGGQEHCKAAKAGRDSAKPRGCGGSVVEEERHEEVPGEDHFDKSPSPSRTGAFLSTWNHEPQVTNKKTEEREDELLYFVARKLKNQN
ncbi:unnamed protein product [Amoebophrya sp. A120]|nr:unnamed protein product [Amoebophrya sp. A120]|eukprot:GSA120T00014285001.1